MNAQQHAQVSDMLKLSLFWASLAGGLAGSFVNAGMERGLIHLFGPIFPAATVNLISGLSALLFCAVAVAGSVYLSQKAARASQAEAEQQLHVRLASMEREIQSLTKTMRRVGRPRPSSSRAQ